MQTLGTFTGYGSSQALAISADGSVIVGESSGHAFRWTAAYGLQDIGTLGSPWATAYGVSADGAVIVGMSPRSMYGPSKAFRWTKAPADFDGSGFVDTDDFTAFVLAFEAGGDDADVDGSGFVDTDDFTTFVLAFEAEC